MKRVALLLLLVTPLSTGCHRLLEKAPPVPMPDPESLVEDARGVVQKLAGSGDFEVRTVAVSDLLHRQIEQDRYGYEDVKGVVEGLRTACDSDNSANTELKNLRSSLDTLRVYAAEGEPIAPAAVQELGELVSKAGQNYHARGSELEQVLVQGKAYAAEALHRMEGGDLRNREARLQYAKLEALRRLPGSIPGWLDARPGVEDLHNDFQKRHFRLLNRYRYSLLALFLMLCGGILAFIRLGRRGARLSIRKISGLAAIEEAVGRATEMGKPVLFVTGILDVDNIQTLAGLNILGHVAEKTAEYETDLTNPNLWPLTLSSAQELTKESYLRAGKPDAYRSDFSYYLTQDQFAFAAGVSGYMLRERPAAAIYMGAFYAESLLLAEVGTQIGSIQIAGTAMVSQLPFFVSACDYTLIGEELFAASAYLSGEPTLLGSLKGQDAGKAFLMAALLIGCLLELLIAYGLFSPSWTIAFFFEYL